MRRSPLRRRRSWEQRAILTAFALVVTVVAGVAAGLAAYVEAATDAGVRTALTESPDDQVGLEVSGKGADDPLAEDTAVTEHIAALLPGVPYDLYGAGRSGRATSTPARTARRTPKAARRPGSRMRCSCPTRTCPTMPTSSKGGGRATSPRRSRFRWLCTPVRPRSSASAWGTCCRSRSATRRSRCWSRDSTWRANRTRRTGTARRARSKAAPGRAC